MTIRKLVDRADALGDLGYDSCHLKGVNPCCQDKLRPERRSNHLRTNERHFAAVAFGAAWLVIAGDDPALLANQDPGKVARADRARWTAPPHILNFDVNWSAVSYATPAWAKAVFPKEAEDAAAKKL